MLPSTNDYNANLVSGHHNRMRHVHPHIKFGIIFWFSGIVRYYTEHPVYSLLFGKNDSKEEFSAEKVHLGMNEVTLSLRQLGFGSPETMNLNDFFDAQIKHLKDIIQKALSEGMNEMKLSDQSGIPLNTIYKLK